MVIALVFTIMAACSKHELEIQSFRQESTVHEKEVHPSVFFSDWETVPAWTTQKDNNATSFSYTRQFPGLNESLLTNGAVLVFARNLWADDPAFKELKDDPEKPLMMPFYFLPYFEKPNYTEQWGYNKEENKINVSLIVKGTSEASMPRNKIQLRYIVIPENILHQKHQTAQQVRKLCYDELIKTFSLSS